MLQVHQYAAARRRFRRAYRSSSVQVVRVDPLLMVVARDIAGGELARVRILGPSEALVLNRPRGGSPRR
jgi:hypothetical protein